MTDTKYTMITIAGCDASFMAEAVPLTVKLAGELVDKAGSISARTGTVVTGNEAGCLFLAQTYADISGIDRAFAHYAASDTYAKLIGSGYMHVKLRSIIRLEDISIELKPGETPKYLVLTRWRAADPMTDRARAILPVFENNGAMMARYGTSIAGPMAGARVLGVGYPSMDAIEKTYTALTASADYQSFVSDIEIVSRNIIRVAG